MAQNRKYLIQKEHPYPHIGQLLSHTLRKRGWAKTDLCRALEISETGVTEYCKHPSIQLGILWKAGVAIKYNFFAELAAQFPFPPDADNVFQKRIDELEKELAIYKSIVHRQV